MVVRVSDVAAAGSSYVHFRMKRNIGPTAIKRLCIFQFY